MLKAIVPTAGLGTRLRPITEKIPKALIQVGDKPTIHHIITLIESLGIEEVILVIGHLGHMLADYVQQAFPKLRFEFVQQREPLGLGHAIWLTREKAYGDEVLIIYGDTILEAEIASAFSRPGDGALGVKTVDDPSSLGVAILQGERVVKLVEKPKEPVSNIALIGVSFFRNSSLLFDCLTDIVEKNLRTVGEIQATDAFDLMVQRGAYLTTFPVNTWLDCGTLENLLATNRYLLDKKSFVPELADCKIFPPVFVGEGAIVRQSTLGPYVSVAPGAFVEGCVLENCIVERTAKISGLNLAGRLIG